MVAGGLLAARQHLDLPLLVADRDPRPSFGVLGLDDRLAGQTGDLVEGFAHGDALDDVVELHRPADLGQQRHRERVPFRDQGAGFDLLTLLDQELGAVDDLVALSLAAGGVHHHHFAVSVHHHQGSVGPLHRRQVGKLDRTGVPVFERGLLRAPSGSTADVEGSHRQLGTRLADRLRGDYPHRLAEAHLPASRQVAAIALDADAAPRLAGQNRSDFDLVQAGVFDLRDSVLVDLLVRSDQHLAGQRIVDVVQGHAAEDSFSHRLDDFAAFHQGADVQAVHGAAVVLGDDRILRHVHQAPGQITGVGGLERGVRQALAGPVGGNEVLQHREAFPEVRGDRRLDDFARGLGHQAAHSSELPDLLSAAARPRVRHDVDRVERWLLSTLAFAVGAGAGNLLLGDLLHHLAGDFLGDFRPDVDHLVVALAVGDQTLEVLILDLRDLLARIVQELMLSLGDHHVLERDRDARLGGVGVSQGANPVGQKHGFLLAGEPVTGVDQVSELFLVQHLVDLIEPDLRGNDLPQQHPADGALLTRSVDAADDLRLQVDLAVVVRGTDLLGRGEDMALSAGELPRASHVIDPEHHVLSGDDDRLAVRRA